MFMTSVGVPSVIYETVKNLRQARGQRLGACQRKFPRLGIWLLYILALLELAAFPLLGAGTVAGLGVKMDPSRVFGRQSLLFAGLAGATVLVVRCCGLLCGVKAVVQRCCACCSGCCVACTCCAVYVALGTVCRRAMRARLRKARAANTAADHRGVVAELGRHLQCGRNLGTYGCGPRVRIGRAIQGHPISRPKVAARVG